MDTFKVNQMIVYPSHGIGKVTEIFTRDFLGKPTKYYSIYIESSQMNALVPIDKAASLGIRQVVSRDEAEQALVLLGDKNEVVTSDWKLRYQTNMDLLKSGTIGDIARIVRSLFNRSRIKELPVLERKLYDNARRLLIEEISLSLGQTIEEVEENVMKILEPLGQSILIKPPVIDEDEEDEEAMEVLMGPGALKRKSDDDEDEDDDDDEDDDEVAKERRKKRRQERQAILDDDDEDDDGIGDDLGADDSMDDDEDDDEDFN